MLPEVEKTKKVSKFLWGAALVLIIAAFAIPEIDFTLQEDSPRADAIPDPFDQRVRDFEAVYHNGELADADPDRALDYAPHLKARALTDVGPMSAEQLIGVVDIIEEYRPQIAAQPDQRSRLSLRHHRNEQIVADLHRLDDEQAVAAIDAVRDDYIEAFDLDPSAVSTPPADDGTD